MPEPATLALRVTEVTALTPTIKTFRLASADGAALPGFEPGAHVCLQLDLGAGPPQSRAYSLINFDPARDVREPQADYRIAVRRDAAGAGGSRHLHEAVREGSLLPAQAPRNLFPLAPSDDVLLIAGGIGITPLISMAAALRREGRRFDLVYAARSRAELAYAAELRELCGPRLHLHVDDDAGAPLAVGQVLGPRPGRPVHVCGPRGLIDAVTAQALALGWHASDVHFELFGTPTAPGDAPAGYEIELARTGRRLRAVPGRALLDVLVDNGVDLMYDCRAGFCGLCTVQVVSGQVEHRDTCLSADEQARGRMQPCVSHATSGRLVLDL